MANTLTNLIPEMYAALDRVSREMVGFIPAVTRNSSGEGVGLNDTIRIPVTQAASATTVTPGLYAPDTGDQTIDNVTMAVDNSRAVYIRWNGEQQKSYANNGTLVSTLQKQFEQAFRTLADEIDTDIANEYVRASRAYGTAGTTPFASAFSDIAQVKKLLDDNGAPKLDRRLVMGTAAAANLLGLSGLNTVNASGTDATLRRGELPPIHGFNLYESANVISHTKGAGTGYDINNGSGEAVGQTTLTLDGGTVNTTGIKAGDVVTFAGDTNKYIVTTGLVATSGDIVIANPGLLVAAADTTEMTIGDSYAANMAFHSDAIQLLTRVPAMPMGLNGMPGDMADDVQIVTDPVTGLAFQVAVYKQFKQIVFEVSIAWGTKLIKPEHCVILLG